MQFRLQPTSNCPKSHTDKRDLEEIYAPPKAQLGYCVRYRHTTEPKSHGTRVIPRWTSPGIDHSASLPLPSP